MAIAKKRATRKPAVKSKTKQLPPESVESQVKKRNRLAELLTEAAKIEHDVMVQYLFAAASLKKSYLEGGVTYEQLEKIRGWNTTLLMVARQEMEHLGYVSNLLTAIGQAPIFRRPAFPVPETKFPLNLPSSLDAFNADVALRFVCFEMPRNVDADKTKFLSKYIKNFNPATYDGIYRMYMEILSLFEEIDEKDLFIGPPSAQFLTGGNSVNARGRIYPAKNTGKPQPIYDTELLPVTDLKSAKAAITQIIDEGEGATEESTTSHFARFYQMFKELRAELDKDPNFKPARDVVSNPRVVDADDDLDDLPGVTPIKNAETAEVMRLFDSAYSTMILMLMRYFAHSDESDSDLVGLQNVVFFPMMTIGIRPLAEILTKLPADTPATNRRAGPSFTLPKSVQLLPHRKSAWQVILGELQMLTEQSEKVQNIKSFSPETHERLVLIHQNFARMVMNFQDAMHAKEMQ